MAPRSLSLSVLLTAALGCGDDSPPPVAETGSSSTAAASSSSTTAPADGTSSSSGRATDSTSSSSSSSGTTSGGDTTAGTTGQVACTKNVVLMGYWPPTNEMLRPWSTDPQQNPGGWIGEDWGGYGYDVYAFFPEFPPDGDPTNDSIGDDGAVGSPRFPLRVDYQATSMDFWPIVDELRPSILITTSRGGGIGWELEAIEGGHSGGGPNPAFDWSSDQHGVDQYPTQETILPRSWDAISTYRQGNTLPSQLPLPEILTATDALGLTSVQIDEDGTSGDFLSGFLGLHGLYYRELTPHAVAAGHIHVGFGLPVADASQLIDATLHVVLQQHPAETVECPPPK